MAVLSDTGVARPGPSPGDNTWRGKPSRRQSLRPPFHHCPTGRRAVVIVWSSQPSSGPDRCTTLEAVQAEAHMRPFRTDH